MTSTTVKAARSQKADTHAHLKLVHSFNTQIKPLRDYLNQLLKMVPQYAEPGKRQAILDHICNVVRDHGNDGLKLHRKLFIQGIKVLGGDSTTDFTGFALDAGGFPRHYGDLFRLLESYRRYEVKETEHLGVVRDFDREQRYAEVARGRKIESYKSSLEVVSQPTDTEGRQISLLLSILRWPYSVKLDLSSQFKFELLESFGKEIEDPSAKQMYSSQRVSERIAGELLRYMPSNYKDPFDFVPSERTYKGGRPRKSGERRIPSSLAYASGISDDWSYKGPVGEATVLSEKAGKTRFITSYDGSINSSNLYGKLRATLDNIESDCSGDQHKGHLFLKHATGNRVGKVRKTQTRLYSTDLDAFTDRLVLNAYRDLLELYDSSDYIGCITAPILVNGRTVYPQKSLMGLRGTFELASLVHHGIAFMCGLLNRVLCGDDLFYISDDHTVLQRYEALCSYVGLKLNRSKTVISDDTGIFCGKVYFRGIDVSPVVPPLYSFSSTPDDFVSSAGNFIDSAKRLGPGFSRAAAKLVLRFGSSYSGIFIPYLLPFKLGGVGIDRAKGLLLVLKTKAYRLACRVPDIVEPLPMRTVRYPCPPIGEKAHSPTKKVPDRIFEEVFGWNSFSFHNLLDFGHTQRFRKTRTVTKRSVKLKALHEILCYFYGIPA